MSENIKFTKETDNMTHLFEPALRATLSLELSKLGIGDIFIDVGACVGTSCLLKGEGMCFAFEMDPDAILELRRNIGLNENKNIIIMNIPLSNEEIGYEIVKKRMGDTEIKKNRDLVCPKTSTLDNIFFNVSSVKVIKIDVEGEDYNVLLGGLELIKKHRPVIIVEVGDSGTDHLYVDFFKSLNYSIDRIGINIYAKP